MNKIKALLLLWWLAAAIHVHAAVADSLAAELQREKTDSNRVKLIYAIACAPGMPPDSAIQWLKKGAQLAARAKYFNGEIDCITHTGNIYSSMGNYPRALEHFYEALHKNEKEGNKANLAFDYNSIGIIYSTQGNYRQSLHNRFRALDIYKELNDERGIITVLLNIGDVYEKMNLPDSALHFTQQGLDKATALQRQGSISVAHNNLGNIFLKMNLPDSALSNYRQSLPYFLKTNRADGVFESALGLARIFNSAAQPDSALHYARMALQYAQQSNNLNAEMQTYSFLSAFYKSRQQNDSAFIYLEKHITAKDSLFGREKVKEVQNLMLNQKIMEQEAAAQKARAEEERKINMQLMGIAAFIITFILFLLMLSKRKAHPKLIEYTGIVALLLVFEFIALLIHPFIEHLTHHTPVYMLLILMGVAAVLAPLHHRLEKYVKERLASRPR